MSEVRFKFRCNIISGKIIKEMPGSVASGTPYIKHYKLMLILKVVNKITRILRSIIFNQFYH